MPKTPRVLHLRASNFFGGPERQILRYTHVEGIESAIASFTGDGCGTEFLRHAADCGLPTFELPAGKKNVVAATRKLTALLREQQVDVLCTHDYRSNVLGLLAARKAHVCCIPFLRGWTAENSTIRFFEAIDRRLLPFATRVVCLSETHATQMRKHRLLAGKVRVVRNAIEIPGIDELHRENARRALCRRFDLRPGSPIVVSAGRLSPEKGVSIFLHAMPQILKAHANAQFVVFGDGAEKDMLQTESKVLGLESALTFAGHVTDLSDLLPGADLLVNPSFAEQVPNVVLEALAAGIPVVATRAGAVAEIAGDPPCIALVHPGTADEIAVQAVGLLNDPVRRNVLRECGLSRLRTDFSPEVQRRQIADLLRELVPSYAPAPMTARSAPFVSIVIPVRNEERHLGPVLDRLLEQDYPRERFEIIVADGNSTDRTADVVNRFAGMNVFYAPNPAQLSSAGRNTGVRNSRGEIIVFVDGHCEITSRSLLSDTVDLLNRTGADCLARPQPLTVTNASTMQKAIAAARASMLGHGTDSTIFNTDYEGPVDPTSSGAVYRRQVFDRIGLYNESFDACEDVEFNHRVKQAGLKCWISPRLTVRYHPRRTLGQLFRQMHRYGLGRARLAKTHREAFTISQVAPALLVLAVALGTLFSLFVPAVRPFYVAGLLCYAIALALTAIANVGKTGLGIAVLIPAALVMIHTGLGFGFLSGLWERSIPRIKSVQTSDKQTADTPPKRTVVAP